MNITLGDTVIATYGKEDPVVTSMSAFIMWKRASGAFMELKWDTLTLGAPSWGVVEKYISEEVKDRRIAPFWIFRNENIVHSEPLEVVFELVMQKLEIGRRVRMQVDVSSSYVDDDNVRSHWIILQLRQSTAIPSKKCTL